MCRVFLRSCLPARCVWEPRRSQLLAVSNSQDSTRASPKAALSKVFCNEDAGGSTWVQIKLVPSQNGTKKEKAHSVLICA